MTNLKLRDYQIDAVNSVLDEFKAGFMRQLIILPTGSGKTIVMAAIAKQFNKKTILLAHREELITQAVDKFKLFWPEVDIGVCMAERDEIDNQVVIASVQSASRPKRLERLKEQGFELMMVDETHHILSDSYQNVIKALGFSNNGNKLLLGVTATPKQGLGNIFDKITFSRSIGTMIKAGYLSPVVGRKILTNFSMKEIKTFNGDFSISDLSEVVNTPERNDFIVSKFKEYANDRKTVAFCCDVKHCQDLAEAFNKQGIVTSAVWGDMECDHRKSVLENLKNGNIQVATSCGVLVEGYDEPSINAIVMARPTKSQGYYIQCVGRGLRNYPGKSECLVLDFSDQHHNLDGVISLTSTIPEAIQTKENVSNKEREEIDMRPKIEVFSECDKEFDILGCTRFIWVKVGDSDEWSLIDDDKNEIIMHQKDNGYIATIYFSEGSSRQIINSPLPLEYCSGVCEDFARRHLKVEFAEMNKPWMTEDSPPTKSQIEFLRKQGSYHEDLNKVEASLEIRKIIALKNKQRRSLNDEMITDKQKYFLKSHGIETRNMSKLEAMQRIAKMKQMEA